MRVYLRNFWAWITVFKDRSASFYAGWIVIALMAYVTLCCVLPLALILIPIGAVYTVALTVIKTSQRTRALEEEMEAERKKRRW